MKYEWRWIGGVNGCWRILPELTLSFEKNPHRDLYVYAGWLCFAWEFTLANIPGRKVY